MSTDDELPWAMHLVDPDVMEQVQRRIDEAARRAYEVEKAFRRSRTQAFEHTAQSFEEAMGTAARRSNLVREAVLGGRRSGRAAWMRDQVTAEWPLAPMTPELLALLSGGLLPAEADVSPPDPKLTTEYRHPDRGSVWLVPWQEELLGEGLEQHGWSRA